MHIRYLTLLVLAAVNVAGFKPSVAYGAWTKIEGFSEGIIRYIAALEQSQEQQSLSSAE